MTEAVNKVVLDPGDAADSRLLKKLKQVKMDLKTWNRKNKEENNKEIEAFEETCCNFELKAELGLICDSEYDEWAEAKSKWNQLENEKTHDSRQKSRIKWVIDGDENSSFFHRVCKAHTSGNRLNGLRINNRWVTNPRQVKKEVWHFFRDKFKAEQDHKSCLLCPSLKKISDVDSSFLVSPFTREEVK